MKREFSWYLDQATFKPVSRKIKDRVISDLCPKALKKLQAQEESREFSFFQVSIKHP